MTNQVNTQMVYELLNGANWDYEYSGSDPDNSMMENYLSEIESGISLSLVESEVEDWKNEIEEEFPQSEYTDVNRYAAYFIADRLGRKITKCMYENVTFITNV